MSKQATYTVRVEFGDCDPARIVWFPNFFRWIDAASRHFFIECGVPTWNETEKTLGVIGTPLVDTHARFVKTASYGDTLSIQVSVAEWRDKSFVQRHRVVRHNAAGEADLIMECDEVRIFAGRRADNPEAIRALPIPPEIRRLCE
ncbi:acyl-CoA thioesterase [Variovorax terrae]|uniref:Acyl-CoA thioesterase n=1 Tax=Variovorax terrae TaxID=2923278 RepID=A0A9X1VUA0_9BURK|nr:acyl-CoA thioesterase [Variovorax terrae]MCJ0762164.1 acyl-CoA thioesterase [Variovorax terrae]